MARNNPDSIGIVFFSTPYSLFSWRTFVCVLYYIHKYSSPKTVWQEKILGQYIRGFFYSVNCFIQAVISGVSVQPHFPFCCFLQIAF